MTTEVRAGLSGDWLADVIAAAGLACALNTVGDPEARHLELVVAGRVVAALDLCGDHAEAAGVEVAAALLACHDGGAWELRLWAGDEGLGADLLLHEWGSPS